jgi:tRNA G10  N-methylase Trm11
MLSNANELVAGDRLAVARLSGAIEAATGLSFNGRSGDAEFWAMTRSGGDSYLGKRVSRHNTVRDLPAGALRPELAALLCLISEPQAADVFLDPFAGSGAIPVARARWPYNMIFASDSDEAKMEALKRRARTGDEVKVRKNSPFIARPGDATALERIEDGFVDTVVTDPPWGQFDTAIKDVEGLYRAVMREMVRVVKSGGAIVMLLGDRDLAGHLGREILVSGKKAIVVKWRRT